MKYPIGIQDFESLRNNGYEYVDKTELIYKLVQEGTYYFLSRPRRFGKSLLMSTLAAYFSGKRELFHGLAIDKLEKDWTVYPVLHLDLNTDKYDSQEVLESRLNLFLSHWEQQYGRNPNEVTFAQRFEGIISRVATKEGKAVVILVDEYDKPMLQAINNDKLQTAYRNTLKAFYGALKTQDRYIRFALLTGVTKFGKVSVFSDQNNLTDISMDESYDTLCGITEEEMHRYFEEGIQKLADRYDISYEEACARLKKRYDGYHFVEYGTGVYNPFSLLSTFRANKFGSFWFETGTPTFLVQLLQRENFYLPDLTQQQVSADMLNSIDAMDRNPIPVIYQSGYLTIKDYDEEFKVYTLGFPNEEVKYGFLKSLFPEYIPSAVPGSGKDIFTLRRFLLAGDTESIHEVLTALFASIPYTAKDAPFEHYFQTVVYLVFTLLGQYVHAEVHSSRGRADCVLETDKFVYIFEFKVDKSAQEALEQIEAKGYAAPYGADERQLFKIGVNFDSESRSLSEWLVG